MLFFFFFFRRHIETLENDLQIIRQHIQSLNCVVKDQSTEQQEAADVEQDQIVQHLDSIQQEIQDVTQAKHDLEVQVSSLSQQKEYNEKYYSYFPYDLCVCYFLCREILRLQADVHSLRKDHSQVTALKDQLSNEAHQLRNQLQDEVSFLCGLHFRVFERFPNLFCVFGKVEN